MDHGRGTGEAGKRGPSGLWLWLGVGEGEQRRRKTSNASKKDRKK